MTDVMPIAKDKPDVQLKTEVVEFMETRLVDVDSQFSSLKPRYDLEKSTFVPHTSVGLVLTDTSEIKQARTALFQTVQKWNDHLRKKGGTDSGVHFFDHEHHNWQDVISSLENAQKCYRSVKDEGFRGRMRAYLRKCNELKGPIESWIRLLPAESWQGSVICGGIKIIVGIAAQLDELREGISSIIEEIPMAIESATKFPTIYDNQKLELYSQRLIVAVPEVMQRCLEWFMHSSVKKVMKAAWKGKEYGKNLEDKIKELQAIRGLMSEAARNALHARIGAEAEKNEISRSQTEEILERMKHLEKEVSESRHNVEALNSMKSFLDDTRLRREELDRIDIEKRQIQAEKKLLRKQNDKLTRHWKDMLLMAMLEWDRETSLSDLALSFRIGQSLSMEAQIRTSFILHSEQVESWIAESSNQYLVVNVQQGTADVIHSTASFFSALLLRALESTNPGVKFQWFGGQHHREDPEAMTRGLLGQLVHHGLKNVHHSRLPNLDELSADFKSICEFFLACLSLQLEEGPVYCVLDSVSLYEDKRRIRDLLLLITGITQLSGKFPLKLMITSPVQCSYPGTFRDGMKPSVLWVPQVVPPSWR